MPLNFYRQSCEYYCFNKKCKDSSISLMWIYIRKKQMFLYKNKIKNKYFKKLLRTKCGKRGHKNEF